MSFFSAAALELRRNLLTCSPSIDGWTTFFRCRKIHSGSMLNHESIAYQPHHHSANYGAPQPRFDAKSSRYSWAYVHVRSLPFTVLRISSIFAVPQCHISIQTERELYSSHKMSICGGINVQRCAMLPAKFEHDPDISEMLLVCWVDPFQLSSLTSGHMRSQVHFNRSAYSCECRNKNLLE